MDTEYYAERDKFYENLRKENEEAKEIIREFLRWFNSDTQPCGNFRKITIKAERFLKKQEVFYDKNCCQKKG